MISRPALSLFALCVVALATVDAFVSPQQSGIATATTMQAPKTMFAKKDDFDISSIESRDMTRAEMLELNKKNEDIMNMELQMMTGFSLVISIPILYLCWVAFFSD